MRTRRQFQPMLDWMPSRIAPSSMAVAVDPMDSTTSPTDTTPTLVSPMDPTTDPGTGTSVTSPTIGGSGSFVQPINTTSLC